MSFLYMYTDRVPDITETPCWVNHFCGKNGSNCEILSFQLVLCISCENGTESYLWEGNFGFI